MALAAGTPAPDFTLLATPDQSLSLSEIEGPAVLIFYPADWSPVCGDELTMFEAASKLFAQHRAQLIGISVDGAWSHTAFREQHKIEFPLLADFNPKGAVARAYEVYDEKNGLCERALFVVDRDKQITWSYVSPVGVSPGADGALNAVEALS
ncbi:MAG TPA: redoxin domain-containing protein [Acidimicrobiales bacterium]|jgi:peroxiredoxin